MTDEPSFGVTAVQPTYITVDKELLISSLSAAEIALDYAKSALADHDLRLGRNGRKNAAIAQIMQVDIRNMESLITKLRKSLGYNDLVNNEG